LRVERQVECPIIYKGQHLSQPLRIDLLVEGTVIVECKATVENNPLFAAQCLTYLRLSNLRLGLVIIFGMKHLREGIERVVN
jgi:GxxExxY protein